MCKCVKNHYFLQLEVPQQSGAGSRLSPGNLRDTCTSEGKNHPQKTLSILGILCSQLLSSWLTGTTQPGHFGQMRVKVKAAEPRAPQPCCSSSFFPAAFPGYLFLILAAVIFNSSAAKNANSFLSTNRTERHLPLAILFLILKICFVSPDWTQSFTSKLLQERFLGKGSMLWLQGGFHWNTLMEDIHFPCFPPTCKSLRGFVSSFLDQPGVD